MHSVKHWRITENLRLSLWIAENSLKMNLSPLCTLQSGNSFFLMRFGLFLQLEITGKSWAFLPEISFIVLLFSCHLTLMTATDRCWRGTGLGQSLNLPQTTFHKQLPTNNIPQTSVDNRCTHCVYSLQVSLKLTVDNFQYTTGTLKPIVKSTKHFKRSVTSNRHFWIAGLFNCHL